MPEQRKGKNIRLLYILASATTLYQIPSSAGIDNAQWDCKQHGEEWVCLPPQKAPSEPVLKKKTPPNRPQAIPLKSEISETTPKIIVGQVPTMPEAPSLGTDKSQPEGWTCLADEARSGWRCKLRGTDPGGKPRLAARKTTEGIFELPATFTPQDERIFADLLRLLPQNPWEKYCQSRSATLGIRAMTQSRQNLPLKLESDFSQSIDDEILFFSGNVKVERGQQKLWADALTYDDVAETVNAWDSVIYEEEGFIFASDSGFLDLENDKARLRNTRFILSTIPARGVARRSRFESEALSRHHSVAYTTCPPGNEDWVLHAKDLKINREVGTAFAHHAWLEFKGVPFLYSPVFGYPIDDRRMTGFLTPSFGRSEINGIDFSIPYYWNIAPNYDLTLIPRILSQRGFMLGTEFRYLFKQTRGRFAFEILPYDTIKNATRGQLALFNQTRFNPYWSSHIDIRYVSDKHYINDLGNTLSIASNRHMRSEARIDYRQGGWHFLAKAENWQTIDPNIPKKSQPYRRLPQLKLRYDANLTPWSHFNWDSEFVFFHHQTNLKGHRFDVNPSFSFPWRTAATFVIPKLSVQHTRYWLLDPSADGRKRDSLTRTIPYASVDSGIFLEKSWGKRYLQTLEPRVFYLYVPRQNQDDIPVFDTTTYDFNFSQLFRDNRFSGRDRRGDANQFSVALTSRFLESETGRERLRASVGQIYYLKDRRVTLPGKKPETRRSSNIIGELDWLPWDVLSLRSGAQWNPQTNRFDRGEALLQYKDTDDYIFNLSYRFRRKQLRNIDGSFRWLVYNNLHMVGRWQYSLRDNITLESFLGVELESCCWRLRLIGRHYIRDIRRSSDNAIFAQLELKGLATLGKRVDRFLERNIRGYEISD
ncbi:MAG: hypothetical protein AXA67_00100 [Methylothermaceae bacteria B42]|nr:MAG: hypothetical protein AXA67_00100 [Methylothermaceae bacteria B42]HHJ38883.1 LPS-assembly protein LptD [Methylothermaceae bacterium]